MVENSFRNPHPVAGGWAQCVLVLRLHGQFLPNHTGPFRRRSGSGGGFLNCGEGSTRPPAPSLDLSRWQLTAPHAQLLSEMRTNACPDTVGMFFLVFFSDSGSGLPEVAFILFYQFGGGFQRLLCLSVGWLPPNQLLVNGQQKKYYRGCGRVSFKVWASGKRFSNVRG